MDLLMESLIEEWNTLVRLTPRLLAAGVALALFALGGLVAARALARVLGRARFTETHRVFFRKLTVWGFLAAGLLVALNILDFKVLAASLAAGGGATAVVLGFAFREVGENLLAGVSLAFSRPFELGDLIQCGDLQGTVRAIELRSTHIRSADGRDIFIPSVQIFSNPLVNFTLDGLRRIQATVGIDYGDDCTAACGALEAAVRGVAGVLSEPAPRVHLSALASQWVEIEVLFWVDVKKSGTDLALARAQVLERCRKALQEGGFTVSASVSSNLAVASPAPLDVRLSGQRA